MFDTMKVAQEIRKARIAKNMTQMNLADEMGVSYQAVSNWERGNSMPDIGKLDELCKILDMSLDQLLGARRQVQSVQKVIDYTGGKAETFPSLEEIGDAAPLMKPTEVEECVEGAKETEVHLSELIGIAPFVGKETLDRLAERIEAGGIDLCGLSGIAPFVGKETLDRLAERIEADGIDLCGLSGIAPFVGKETLDRLVERTVQGNRRANEPAEKAACGETRLNESTERPPLGREILERLIKRNRG